MGVGSILDDQNAAPAALHDSARRLEAVLNNATVAIFLMDDRQHCIYMNRAAEELTGYSLDEVASLDRPLHDIIHHTYPDGRPFPLEECAIDRAFPEHHKVGGEEIFVHKDGTFYPVAFMASPIKDDASKTVGTIIEVRGIREEKVAAELQRRLINELDHRARNTLATIQAVAWQSFRGAEPERLARFNGRIAALSEAHAILKDTSWRGADLRPVIEAAIAPFGIERFSLGGPLVEIDPKAVVSFSIALHELGTNARTYGALRAPEGHVSIHWQVDDRRHLQLRWQEEGVESVEGPSNRGFGLQFIERQLAMEFGGTGTFDFRPDGVRCLLRLDLPPVTEPLDLTMRPEAEQV